MSIFKGAVLLAIIILGSGYAAFAQSTSPDSLSDMSGDLSELVVTATKSSRKQVDVPIPVLIVGQDEIQSSGANRLDEILSEQTGLAIINDHGFGVQMQGMDPDYTLILINGEPLIGRTAGTLDLSRISLSDVERIEIIKGPSSGLYGSDALAGVINIITRDSQETSLGLHTRYGAHHLLDQTLTGNKSLGEKGHATLSANRFSTKGYDLSPDTYGKTIDPYADYTFQGRLDYQLTPRLKFDLYGRYFTETQKNDYLATSDLDTILVKGDGKEKDGSLSPTISYRFSSKWQLKWRSYGAFFKTKSDLKDTKADTAFEESFFNQTIWKEELQSENILDQKQILTSGIGFSREAIRATRYPSKETLSNYFVYGQHEWHPSEKWNILSGMRYDVPSDYTSRLSPKLAVQYKKDRRWTFRASVGMGYKAPDSRQLYLTFANSVVGYSVLGAKEMRTELMDMQSKGLIDRLYIDLKNKDVDLKPEHSIAYNMGGTYTGTNKLKVNVNFFLNDIDDLIDTKTVALKSNGQPVYSYYNVNKVVTKGIETEIGWPLWSDALRFNAGYQFLIAWDKEVVKNIKNGKEFIRDPQTGEIRKLSLNEYGGLFNRSRHTFNAKLFYHYKDWTANVRGMYRSRFGFADVNGNNLLDADNEYASGYFLLHLNVGKTLWSDRLRLQAGVKDLFNYTNPAYLSYIPGRTWYVSADIRLFNSKKTNQ